MNEIWDREAMPLYRGGFKITPEIIKAEEEVERMQGLVQQGYADVPEHKHAVDKLVTAIVATGHCKSM
jgi:hypothetical protein